MAEIEEESEPAHLSVESGVAARDLSAFVQIQWPNGGCQMTPDEARAFALQLFEVAESADTDSFLFHFSTERIGLDENRAGQILQEFRVWRDTRRAKNEDQAAEEDATKKEPT